MARQQIGSPVPIDLVEARFVLESILEWRQRGATGYVTCVNPHSVMSCRRDKAFHTAVADADLSVADGVGISLAASIMRKRGLTRLPGPSLMLQICEAGRAHGLRHYFLGAGVGVAEQLARRLSERYPGLAIAGTMCPPFRELSAVEEAEIVRQINATKPDVIWVGLGTGKQEKWMWRHVGRVRAAALLGVGAAFDFHAGVIPWAPRWVRRAGVEWAYRLCQEPRRLWRRNLDSPLFLAGVLLGKILPVPPLIDFRAAGKLPCHLAQSRRPEETPRRLAAAASAGGQTVTPLARKSGD